MILKLLKRLLFGRKISQISHKNFQKRLSEIIQKDSFRQVIELDKLYHHILLELGYSGSFGNILKKNPREIDDIEIVWRLHKIRNRLVHDEKHISNHILHKDTQSYCREIKRILGKIKS
ncbi:hypothetical protein LAT59_00185 [Candidatus Gracilibacteria bacterium]|nr:hypothetical protein [Candidatus Gracilibacteria bacterium]